MAEELVVLGVVTRPHGVRGEVRAHRFNAESKLLLEIDRVVVRKDGVDREVRILGRKRSGDADVLALEGCTTPEDAEKLRGAELAVPRAKLPRLAPGEIYQRDLVGLRVVEGGREIGAVLSVETYPSASTIRVRTERGTIEVPLLPPYVVSVDAAQRTIEVAHTEDLDAT